MSKKPSTPKRQHPLLSDILAVMGSAVNKNNDGLTKHEIIRAIKAMKSKDRCSKLKDKSLENAVFKMVDKEKKSGRFEKGTTIRRYRRASKRAAAAIKAVDTKQRASRKGKSKEPKKTPQPVPDTNTLEDDIDTTDPNRCCSLGDDKKTKHKKMDVADTNELRDKLIVRINELKVLHSLDTVSNLQSEESMIANYILCRRTRLKRT